MHLKSLLRNVILVSGALALGTPSVIASASEAGGNHVSAEIKPQHSRTRPAKKKKTAEAAKPATGNKQNSEKGEKRKQNTGKNSAAKNKKAAKTATEAPSGRYRAFKINVPYAALAVQNLSFEWQTGRAMTVDIPVMWSFSDLTDRHGIRTIALQPEARWWPGANPGNGHFLGAHLSADWFNVRWNDNRYQADALPLLGAGISYGYHVNFTPNWGAEFNIGAGYAYMKYDRFYNIDNGAKIDNGSHHYFGITRVGISLVYRF